MKICKVFGLLKMTSGRGGESEFLSRSELMLTVCAWAKKFVFTFMSHELKRLQRPDLGAFRISQVISLMHYLHCRTFWFKYVAFEGEKFKMTVSELWSVCDGHGQTQDTFKDGYSRYQLSATPSSQGIKAKKVSLEKRTVWTVFNFHSHISVPLSLVAHLSCNRRCQVLPGDFSRTASTDLFSHTARFLLQETVATVA